MKKNFFLFSLLAIAFIPLAIHAEKHAMTGEKRIIIAADEWCPYNCTPKKEKEGYIVEIAKEVFAKNGYTVEYQVIPWEQALLGAKEGKFHAVIGANREEGTGLVFPQETIGISVFKFFVPAESAWNYTTPESLHEVAVGVVRGYNYGALDSYFEENIDDNTRVQILSSDSSGELNVKKLVNGRIQALYDDHYVIEHILNENGWNGKVREAGSANEPNPQEDYIYIAFSPEKPEAQELADLYDSGITELRKSGRLKEILARYGLKDWK